MPRLVLSIIFAALLAPIAQANPVIVDSERRPTEMTVETVTVTVKPGASTVSGRYRFRQKPDNWPGRPDKHVLVFIPVLLPGKMGVEGYLKRYGNPVVSYKGRKFLAKPWNDLAQEDSPGPIPVPGPWNMEVLQAKVPLPLPRDFTIELTYIQPNAPGERTAYAPIHPPKNAGDAKITFVAANGYALRPPGFLARFKKPVSRLIATPKDRRLEAAQLVKK